MTRVHTLLAAVLVLLASLLVAGAFVPDLSTASAQTCNSTNSPSPLPAGTPIFRRNDTVYVIIEDSITNQDQIGRGLASWQGTGQSPLMNAARLGHLGIVLRLLDKGADVNAKDASGRTAVTLASLTNRQSVLRALRARGARP
jgi:hypothetical protein